MKIGKKYIFIKRYAREIGKKVFVLRNLYTVMHQRTLLTPVNVGCEVLGE